MRQLIFTVLFAVTCLGLAWSQTTPEAQSQGQKHCPPPPPAEDITGGAKAALACQWLNSAAATEMLQAMPLYLEGSLESKRLAFFKLLKSAPEPSYRHLYLAAVGPLDAKGTPTSRELDEFLPLLASANTREKKMTAADTEALFSAAADVIKVIFDDDEHDGKESLRVINDLFRADYCCFEAVYKLLQAVPNRHPEDPSKRQYLSDLETLRAAYDVSAHDPNLASLVGERVSKFKK